MISVYPDFYDSFSCKAGDCRHSCCMGWEIDVDDATAGYYASLTDDLGRELDEALIRDGEGAHFKLTEEGKCPFLQKNGLCRIILTLGEESLCDICALHPRFYEDLGEYELCGLGLSCERVCELLWDSDDKLTFITEAGDIFAFPEQEKTYEPNFDKSRIQKVLEAFFRTEPIDESWTAEMVELKANIPQICKKTALYSERYDIKRYNRLFCYIMYRQLAAMTGEKLISYATLATDFIFIRDAYFGDTKECIRRFSEQIEYSTENVDILSYLFSSLLPT